jgi:hypothetical protein
MRMKKARCLRRGRHNKCLKRAKRSFHGYSKLYRKHRRVRRKGKRSR